MIKDLMSPVRLRNVLQGKNEDSFLSYIDLWAIEQNVSFGVSGSAAIGFELIGRNILLKTNSEIASFYQAISHLLDNLPYRAKLDIQVSYEVKEGAEDAFQAHRKSFSATDSLAQRMIEERIHVLKEQGIRHTRIFLFLTYHPDASNARFGGSRPDRTSLKAQHEEKIKILSEVEATLTLSLQGIGISSRRLAGEEIALYFYKILNPSRSELIPIPSCLLHPHKKGEAFSLSGPRTARSLLLFSRAWSESEFVTIDGVHHAVVNLHEKPEAMNEWSLKKFLDHLPFEYRLMLTVRTVDQEKVMGEQKVASNFNRNIYEYSLFKNYEAKQKFAELDQFLEEASATTQRPYHFSLSVLLQDTSVENLKDKIKETLLAFRELGEAEAVSEDFDHFPLFFSHLPGHTRRNFRGKHLILTDALAYFFPFYQEWGGSATAPTILPTRRREIFKFDFWDKRLQAGHGLMAGTTGGGKSFLANYFLKDFLLSNPARHHAVVVDVGFSYRKLARFFKGEYHEIDLSGKYPLNPFPDKAHLMNGKEVDLELLTYLGQLLGKMVLDSQNEIFSGADLVLLEHMILEVYKDLSIHDAPMLSDVRDLLSRAGKGQVLKLDEEDKRKATHYAKNLELFTEGLYGRVLNQPGKLAIDAQIIVYNLLKLAEHPMLQNVISFIIGTLIHSKLVNPNLLKLFFFDELQSQSKEDKASIGTRYRISRKYGGRIFSISQSISHYLQGPAAEDTISNSEVCMFTPLQEGYENLHRFRLQEHEVQAVKGLRTVKGFYSECFIKSGDESAIVRLEPTPLEYWLCTTNQEDNLAEESVRREHPDWNDEKVLESLAAHFPHGASAGSRAS